jgi:hypothetical protein
VKYRSIPVGVDKIALGRKALPLGRDPKILNPRPTAVIYIDKVLVVEVNFGEISLIHAYSFSVKPVKSQNFSISRVNF